MTHLRFRKPFVVLLVIFSFIIVVRVVNKYLTIECDPAIIVNDGFSEIPREMLTSETIYFLETHNSTDHELNVRSACSIESAAYMNPNSNIFVLFLSPTKFIRLKNWSQFQGIYNYRNIHLRYFNYDDLTSDTVIEKWMHKGLLKKSSYQVAHTSDILRYALLYKYSGIYLDLDVIVRKPMDEINFDNFACFQDDREIINNAIMKVSDDDGHHVASLLLDEVINNYDYSKWDENGPELVTRVLKKYCNVTDFQTTNKCGNFSILPKERCYPISWRKWDKYFSEYNSNQVMDELKNAYFAHFWNKKSEGLKLRKTSYAPFNQLASKYCPETHASNKFV